MCTSVETVHPNANLSWTGNILLDNEFVRSLVVAQTVGIVFPETGRPDLPDLRRSIGSYYRIDHDWVFPGVGSSQVLDALVRFLGTVRVLDVVPNFHMARLSSDRDHLRYQPVSIRDLSDLPGLLKKLSPPRGSLLMLCAPRNLFGDCPGYKAVRELLSHFPGIAVIDEAYAEFGSSNVIPLLSELPSLIIVRTFSKAWGLANLRIGYAIAPSLTRDFHSRFLLAYNLRELSERSARAMLANPGPVLDSLETVRTLRTTFWRSLSDLTGFFVWPSEATSSAWNIRKLGIFEMNLLPGESRL